MVSKRSHAGGIASQEYELVPVKSLQPHSRNCNDGDVGAIVTSIEANQFYGAVIAQKSTGLILAGKHRWLAAQECGLEAVPTIWADVDDATALRIMLADNRTTRLGHDNEESLASLLQEMLASQGSLIGTGFDADDLDQMLADLGNGALADAEQNDSGKPDDSPVICPKCGNEFYVDA